MGKKILVLIVVLFSGNFCLAACPPADLSGDCFVDHEDFALMANQWLTSDPCIPEDMVYIPDGEFEMGDSSDDGWPQELPVHTVTVDSFHIGKYEITNQQYCEYLNAAYDARDIKFLNYGNKLYASFDDSNSFPYCSMDGQIAYSGGVFRVNPKLGRDMSNDPVLEVTWYGAAAYCNWRSKEEAYKICYDPCDPNWPCDFSRKGYRLPTEAEWEYSARGGLSGKRYPWGDTISHSQANYYSISGYSYDISPTRGYHPDWNDGIEPYTSPVGSFAANGYGLYDMIGNVMELCNDWYDYYYYDFSPTGPTYWRGDPWRVARGGLWSGRGHVAGRLGIHPEGSGNRHGFRIVLDLN